MNKKRFLPTVFFLFWILYLAKHEINNVNISIDRYLTYHKSCNLFISYFIKIYLILISTVGEI